MRTIQEITADLYTTKLQEEQIKNKRIALESELATAIKIPPEWEGSKTVNDGIYKTRLSRKMNITIDSPKIRQLAMDNGLESRLESLFRTKYELNKKIWDTAPENEKNVFASAITVKPGKASFVIELVNQ